MRFKSACAVALFTVGTATALAAPAAADEQLDQQFLAALAERGVSVGSDAKAIDMAQSMCRKLGNGSKKGIETALYYVKDHTNLADDEITTFAGVAAQAYCADKLQKQSG
jgi:predicted transcriptional regulator